MNEIKNITRWTTICPWCGRIFCPYEEWQGVHSEYVTAIGDVERVGKIAEGPCPSCGKPIELAFVAEPVLIARRKEDLP
jgi:hypothetical protein